MLGTTLWSYIPEQHQADLGMGFSDFRVIKMSEEKGHNFTVKGQ